MSEKRRVMIEIIQKMLMAQLQDVLPLQRAIATAEVWVEALDKRGVPVEFYEDLYHTTIESYGRREAPANLGGMLTAISQHSTRIRMFKSDKPDRAGGSDE